MVNSYAQVHRSILKSSPITVINKGLPSVKESYEANVTTLMNLSIQTDSNEHKLLLVYSLLTVIRQKRIKYRFLVYTSVLFLFW